MKSILLGCLFFVLSFSSLYSQTDCQDFSSVIQSLDSEQNATALDSNIISLCVGETLRLIATGEYPNNNQEYEQSDITSSFAWNIGTENTFSNSLLEYQFNEGGIYYISLSMTDVMGCAASPSEDLVIQVENPPSVLFLSANGLACPNQEVSITASATDSTHYVIDEGVSNTVLHIPDGQTPINLPLTIDVFEEGQMVSSLSDLAYVRINIEHSWLRDLQIKLISPNGSSIILEEQLGTTGSEVHLGEPIDPDDSAPVPGIGYDYYFKFGTNLPTWIDWANNNNMEDQIETLPSGEYASFNGIDSLLGSPLNGIWTLEIQDLWGQDNGYIFSWGLGFNPILPRINDNIITFSSVVENAYWLQHPQIIEVNEETLLGLVSDVPFVYQVETEANCIFNYETSIELLDENAIECRDCDSLFVDAGPDRLIDCQNDIISVGASSIGFSSYFEYTWTRLSENVILDDDQVIQITSPGTYVVQLINTINGCTVTDTLVVESTMELPQVDAGTDIFSSCLEEFVLNATASEGTNFSYSWTTVEGSLLTDEATLSPTVNASGIYVLTVVNVETGCTTSDAVEVQLGVDLMNGFETISAACDSSNGTATVLAHPTLDDIQFDWSTGESGSTINNLEEGWYSVTLTNNTCNQSEHQNVFVGSGAECNATIAGRVVLDEMGDCTTDNIGVECILIHLMPIDLYTYTDETGYFEFIVDAGTYTLEYIEEEQYNLLCPQSGMIGIDAPEEGVVYSGANFWVEKAPVQNLCVSVSTGFARPGFLQDYHLQVCNWGEIPEDASLIFQHDSIMELEDLLDVAEDYDPSTYTASWFFPAVPVNACRTVAFNLRVPVGTPLGTTLTQTIEAPLVNDAFPANNARAWTQEVRGSYDPNDKQSFTGDNQFGGAIYEDDEFLDYQIRFQNTGTDTAFTVVIKDTLDAALDVRTIQAGQSSHAYDLEFEGNNVLIFNFKNILLPDSTTNEPASHGFVTFRINRHIDLPFGTSIQNTAAIFFDYNEPIITNQVEHVLSQTVAVENVSPPLFEVFISPNPTQDQTQVFYKIKTASTVSMSLYNVKGQLEKTLLKEEYHRVGDYQKVLDLEELPTGMYWISVIANGQRIWKSLVVQ